MRILLINPPIQDFFFTPQRAYPLGILYLATVLDREGFEVKVLNALEGNKRTTLKIPPNLSYLKKYYQPNKSPFCLFSNYYHFGLSYAEIETEIRLFRPQVVGISANFSAYFDCADKVAQIVKRIDKNIIVVFGGRAVSASAQFVIKHKDIDFAIKGEAEFSFLELCNNLSQGKLSKISGLCYRLKNKTYVSSQVPLIGDLNSLGFPKRTLINYADYKFKGLTSTALVASRGCNLGCRFCAISERLRFRRANNVLEEMKECFKLGIRHFNFEDDNINFNPEFEKLLDLISENFSGKIKISFMNGLLAYGLTPALCQKLIKAGLTHIDLSIVSVKSRLRHYAERKDRVKDIVSVTDFMAKHEIVSTAHFIISLPQQKFRDCLADLRLLAGKRLFLGPSIFYPVIESGFFRELKDKFCVNSSDYVFFRSSSAYFDKFMPRDEIFSVFYFSRIINFIKQLIDGFRLKDNNFNLFFGRYAKNYNIVDNIIVSANKIDRLDLGMVILDKLLKEGKLFRAEEQVKSGKFHYVFKEEGFIKREHLKKLLSMLKISGVFSNCAINIKRAHF